MRLAVKQGDVEKVRVLIESGTGVNFRIDEHTLLMWAVYEAFYEVAQILIEAGADVTAAHSTTHTVLYHTIESRQLGSEVIQLFLDSGVRIDYTPLHWDIRLKVTPEIVSMLIEAGANVKELNEFDSPVLVTAA
jgi:ankyrin repeat protein